MHYRGLLPLVAQYDGRAVVAESDPETIGESLRESLRLRPQILRRLGWHYVRVHSFDLYSDPAGVAARIAAMLGVRAGGAHGRHRHAADRCHRVSASASSGSPAHAARS